MSRVGCHTVIKGNSWEIYVRSRGERGTKGMTNKFEQVVSIARSDLWVVLWKELAIYGSESTGTEISFV